MFAEPTPERSEVRGKANGRRQLLQIGRLQIVDGVLGLQMLEAVAQEGEAAAGHRVAKPAAELESVVRLPVVFRLFI